MKSFKEYVEENRGGILSNIIKRVSARELRTILFELNDNDLIHIDGKKLTIKQARRILFDIEDQDKKTYNLGLAIES